MQYTTLKLSAIHNIERLYKVWTVIIKFFNDYSSTTSEARYKAIHGECLKNEPKQTQ